MGYRKKAFESLISGLDSGVAALKHVERYKGEFETGSDFDPDPPQAFVRYDGETNEVDLAGGQAGLYVINFTVFLLAVDLAESDVLDIVESVIDWLDGQTIKPTGELAATITTKEVKLLGYWPDGAEVFQIECELK